MAGIGLRNGATWPEDSHWFIASLILLLIAIALGANVT